MKQILGIFRRTEINYQASENGKTWTVEASDSSGQVRTVTAPTLDKAVKALEILTGKKEA